MFEMYIGLHVKYRIFLSDSNKTLIFLDRFTKKVSNITFHENTSSGSRAVACGPTDVTKLMAVVHSFANALKTTDSCYTVQCVT